MRLARVSDNPLIHTGMDESLGFNINGPSMIRVPDWVPNPLGRYYLYFAHHQGQWIRLAYADEPTGPFRIHPPGVLPLEQSGFRNHVASPDVHVDHEQRRIRMYVHGPVAPEEKPPPSDLGQTTDQIIQPQRTRAALSSDGLHFEARPEILAGPYLRMFEYRDWHHGLCMPGVFYRSPDALTNFERGGVLYPETVAGPRKEMEQGPGFIRHLAVRVEGTQLRLFFTRIGDTPEHIRTATLDLERPWPDWEATPSEPLLWPEAHWEGGNLVARKSSGGAIHAGVRALRDPGVFEEAGRTLILYSVAGECGIAAAELHEEG
jgi:hypothetical protein